VRPCVVPADLAMSHNMMDEMSEPVGQAHLDALAFWRDGRHRDLVGTRFPWPLSATGSTGARIVINQLAPILAHHAPALVAASAPRASYRFLEFFTATVKVQYGRRQAANGRREDGLGPKCGPSRAAICAQHAA
jgi:hypothetical protein